MPIFLCESCGRLLYRPQELLGSAWQCPTCGPTFLSDEKPRVSPELEALLKKEYEIGLVYPPIVFADTSRKKAVPAPPFSHAALQNEGSLHEQFKIRSLRRRILTAAYIVWVVIIMLVFNAGLTYAPVWHRKYYWLGFEICLGSTLALGLLGVSVSMIRAFYRNRRLQQVVDSHRGAANSRVPFTLGDFPDAKQRLQQNVELRDSAVRPAAPEVRTLNQQKKDDQP